MATANVSKALSVAAVSSVVMATGILPARAAVMFYTTRTAFEADTTGLSTIGFEGIAPSGSFLYTPSPPGRTLNGVNFADNTKNRQYIMDSAYPGYGFMGSDFLSYLSPGSTANIKFSSPVTAVGTDIAGISLNGMPFQFALSTGDSFIYEPESSDIGFIGFTSTAPITSLTISPLNSSQYGPQLDNFSFGQAKPVANTAPDDAFQIFFGEDLGLGEDVRLSSRPNSDAARDLFFSNLAETRTNTFESFADGAISPLTLNFSDFGNLTLGGIGSVRSTPTGTNSGRYPISGNQYFETDEIFCINCNGFPQEITAFGFYGIDAGDSNGQILLLLENTLTGFSKLLNVNNTASLNKAGGSVFYFGLIADEDFKFNRVTIASNAIGFEDFAVDDITIGQVPEPSSVLGSILAAIGGGLFLKRKQKQHG